MSVEAATVGPRARSYEVIVRPLGDETLVYDGATHQAHCLNRSASLVYARCDGATLPEALGRALARELEAISEDEASGLVALALDRLAEAGLVENAHTPAEESRAGPRSRRAALRALATTSVLPLVPSIVAPSPADAQTCIPRGQACSSSQQCCPGAPCCRPVGPRPPRCSPGGGGCIPP